MDISIDAQPLTPCHRCLGPLVLCAVVPAEGWTDAYRTVPLCPDCDQDRPTGQALLAFFAAHERIEDNTVEEFARLLRTWLEDIVPSGIDDDTVRTVVAAWTAQLFPNEDPNDTA